MGRLSDVMGKWWVTVTVSVMGIAGMAAQAQEIPSFTPVVIEQGTALHPRIADIDGDGLPDLVMVCDRRQNESEPSLQDICWFNPLGAERTVITSVNYRSCGMAVADINGDGWMDIAGMDDVDSNDGNGNSRLFICYHPGREKGVWKRENIGLSDYAKDIEVADLNGDGQADVVIRTVRHRLEIFSQGESVWKKEVLETPPFDGLALGDLDEDQDCDMVINGMWLENKQGKWISHDYAKEWYSQKTGTHGAWNDNNTRVALGDINLDGKPDIVIALSEQEGLPLSWYENPGKPSKSKVWKQHIISREHHLHSLDLADFDGDGALDILTGRLIFHTDTVENRHPVLIIYNRNGGTEWREQGISMKGCYGAVAGDLDGDSDIDVVVPRNYNMGPVTLFRNSLHDARRSLDQWAYTEIDRNRGKWGDEASPEWLRYFGLDASDADGDGDMDLVSGRYYYRNPGGDMTGHWERNDLGMNVDGVLWIDADGDSLADCIAEALPAVYWLEAKDHSCTEWISRQIATVKATGHVNGQGHGIAQLVAGGKPEILISTGEGICCIEIPEEAEKMPWQAMIIAPEAQAEGIGTGDIDGDGDTDICSSIEIDQVGKGISWWENPGSITTAWKLHRVGETPGYADRFKIADINGDGRNDVVVTEERYPGLEPDAGLFWFENKGVGKVWERHLVVEQYSMNNLDCADLDLDGDVDIVTAEHKGPRQTQIFENDGKGNFKVHCIDIGRESHIGTKLFDLDRDGDPDLVSVGWDEYKFMHLWRNEAKNRVSISEDAVDAGQGCFKIETPYATFFLQKENGGFSSIIDQNGTDWVNFSNSDLPQGPALAASMYRGVPNLLNDCPYDGVGHPGSVSCHTKKVNDSTIYVVSLNGRMEYTWTFTSRMAYLTMLKPGTKCPYWFLYEGTPGGSYDPFNQYWGTDTKGFHRSFPDLLKGTALQDHWNWIYFGNECTRSVLVLSQMLPDDKPEMMAYMGNTPAGILSPDGMVVFGFGRKGIEPQLTQPLVFGLTFMETDGLPEENHPHLSARITHLVNTFKNHLHKDIKEQ